jgi:uncharacterized membrane protein
MFVPRRRPHTERGLERLINFSDAVVAIAITLVALPLVDDVQGTVGFGAFFSEHAYGLIAAGISFASIGGFWRDHHRLFERATDYSTILIRLNFVWLASIVFLPIAAVVLVHAPDGDSRAALTLYFATLCLTLTVGNLQELELIRSDDLSDERRPSGLELGMRWMPVVLRLAALAVALEVPAVHLYAFLVLVIEWPIQLLVARLTRRPEVSPVADTA